MFGHVYNMVFSESHHADVPRLKLHTSQILIVLGLFLILLCCQGVRDLDAVHSPRNSYF